MAGFSVDTDVVQGLGQQIVGLCRDLSDAALPSDLPETQVGALDLGRALTEFHAHWRTGHASLLEGLRTLAGVIEQAAASYGKSDSAVGQAADGGGQQ